MSICAKLIISRPESAGHNARREVIVLRIDKPVLIGRHPDCDYVLTSTYSSSLHCSLFAIPSQNGGCIVSCHDHSRNGLKLNGYRLLAHKFTCVHVWKDRREKIELFDPTPPVEVSRPARTKVRLSFVSRSALTIVQEVAHFIISNQKLGSGSFATVHLAFDRSNHSYKQVACKTIRLTSRKKGCEMDQVCREAVILEELKQGGGHPNINRIFATHRDDEFLFIFLQLCTGGDLFTYITTTMERNRRICEAEAKFIMFQLLSGLKFLHDKAVAHRDLKVGGIPPRLHVLTNSQPENILLHAPGPYPRIVIADFGLARPRSYQETFNVCGTVSYLPPEGIAALDTDHLKYIGMPSDCWSAGVILYIMICGSHPFDNESTSFDSSLNWCSHIRASRDSESQTSEHYRSTESRLKGRILDGSIEYQPYYWQKVPNAKQLVSSLLNPNYAQRATVNDALHSVWILSELQLLKMHFKQRCVDPFLNDLR
ncbi:Kinase-like protein [Mycena chlorophos]|uniref:Kinase-like protein n=1 Tax=Mycena chlorophos TaxID=658473 RepID=A0A8H6WDF5_MYCCL|nr:Kinase-like protein [Mycena chlorophos]